jgi:protein TonB
MDAARKWRFNPAMKSGQKAAGRVRVPVDFKLQ